MHKVSVNDKILIENSRREKWGSKKLLNKFSSKNWSRSGLDSLLRRTDATGSADGSGCPRSARTSVNITKVEELICSQENAPGTHRSPQKIEQTTGIARSSVAHYVMHRIFNQQNTEYQLVIL